MAPTHPEFTTAAGTRANFPSFVSINDYYVVFDLRIVAGSYVVGPTENQTILAHGLCIDVGLTPFAPGSPQASALSDSHTNVAHYGMNPHFHHQRLSHFLVY